MFLSIVTWSTHTFCSSCMNQIGHIQWQLINSLLVALMWHFYGVLWIRGKDSVIFALVRYFYVIPFHSMWAKPTERGYLLWKVRNQKLRFIMDSPQWLLYKKRNAVIKSFNWYWGLHKDITNICITCCDIFWNWGRFRVLAVQFALFLTLTCSQLQAMSSNNQSLFWMWMLS